MSIINLKDWLIKDYERVKLEIYKFPDQRHEHNRKLVKRAAHIQRMLDMYPRTVLEFTHRSAPLYPDLN